MTVSTEVLKFAPEHVREVRRLVVDAIGAEEFEQLGSAARQIVASVDPVAATTLEAAISRLDLL